jgi:energy-coupling factor transporter ATP-binding protein EcfA2
MIGEAFRLAEQSARLAQARQSVADRYQRGYAVLGQSARLAQTRQSVADRYQRGYAVLGYTRAMLGAYASWPSQAALDTVTLWAAHAHVRDSEGRLAWRATPRLLLMSGEPGSGKSRVLELLALLCPHTFGLDTEPTAAGLAHSLDKEHATVLIDEADVLFGAGKRRESVRAVINAGYTSNGTVLRMRGSRAERTRVFGPVAIAGLDALEKGTGDSLSATLDRCIIIRMKRAAGEVAAIDSKAERAGEILRVALATWAADHLAALTSAEPVIAGAHGRAAQIWGPLAAAGDEVSEEWGQRARSGYAELAERGGVSDDSAADGMDELAGMFGGSEPEEIMPDEDRMPACPEYAAPSPRRWPG